MSSCYFDCMADNNNTYCRFYKGKKKHVITTQTEHKCVLDSCRQLEAEGIEVGVDRILHIKAHQGYILPLKYFSGS